MVPLTRSSLICRGLVWYLSAAAGTFAIQNSRGTSAGEILAGAVVALIVAPAGMIFAGPAGVAYLLLVRTWVGTVVAGVGLMGATVWVFLWVHELGKSSSTAGLNAVLVAPAGLVPVLGTVVAETLLEHRRRRKLPPPPVALSPQWF